MASRHAYSLANQLLRVENQDAGIRRRVFDAGGNAVEERDGRGTCLLQARDAANRLTHIWGSDGGAVAAGLRERHVYGDSVDAGLTWGAAQAVNVLGRPFKRYDGAGIVTYASVDVNGVPDAAYDLHGKSLESRRQVITDGTIAAAVDAGAAPAVAFAADWQSTPAVEGNYETSSTYDAMGRLKSLRYPEDPTGARNTFIPRYNPGGLLQSVTLDGEVYVETSPIRQGAANVHRARQRRPDQVRIRPGYVPSAQAAERELHQDRRHVRTGRHPAAGFQLRVRPRGQCPSADRAHAGLRRSQQPDGLAVRRPGGFSPPAMRSSARSRTTRSTGSPRLQGARRRHMATRARGATTLNGDSIGTASPPGHPKTQKTKRGSTRSRTTTTRQAIS